MFRNRPFLFVLCVALIAAFGLGIILLLYWYIRSRSQRLTITEQEIRHEQGILSKSRVELGRSKVRSIKVHQSLGQRIFGTGDISFFSAGDRAEIQVNGLPNPHSIRQIVDS